MTTDRPLAALAAADPASAANWSRYRATWVAWKHFRTIAAFLPTVASIGALLTRAANR